MARYKIQGTFRDGTGHIVYPATASVYLTGTTTPASVYTASAGGTAVNSVGAATDGTFFFYVDDSVYALTQGFDITLSATGFDNKTYSGVYVEAQGQGVTLDGVQTLTNKTFTSPVITGGTQSAPTITSPVINTGVSGSAIDDTSTLGTSTTKLATQNATKHYADRVAKVSAQRALAGQFWG